MTARHGQAGSGSIEGVVVRRVQPADREALQSFYARLSEASRYARFLGFSSGLSDTAARTFCTPDHMHVEGFVALVPEERGEQRLVGHLCLEPAGGPRLELAVAVDDRYQGHGIGRRLMEAALEWAQRHHFEAIIASAFADNARVLSLLSSAPFPAHLAPADGGVVDVVIPLVPELLSDQPAVLTPDLLASLRRRRPHHRPLTASRCSRVVWRGTRPPAHGAAGSASRGSS